MYISSMGLNFSLKYIEKLNGKIRQRVAFNNGKIFRVFNVH